MCAYTVWSTEWCVTHTATDTGIESQRRDTAGHRQTRQHSVDLCWSGGQTDRRTDGRTDQTDSLTDGLLPQHTVRWAVTGGVLATVVAEAQPRRQHPHPGLIAEALLEEKNQGRRYY